MIKLCSQIDYLPLVFCIANAQNCSDGHYETERFCSLWSNIIV